MLNKWLKFKQITLPSHCLLCKASHAEVSGVCTECYADLPWHKAAQCPQCALPSLQSHICGACLKTPLAFDRTYAAFSYEFPMDRVLQHYKYSEMLHLANSLASMLLPAIHNALLPDVLIPMPLHPQRIKERGFNQSIEVGRVLARKLNLKMEVDGCQRIKFSPPQASLPYKERIKNMNGAFACQADLSGKHVVLLDDVMTTGASLNALAKVVKAAGAASVECWVIARTLPKK